MSFGTPQSAPGSTGFSFGTPAAPAPGGGGGGGGFSFGSTTITPVAAPASAAATGFTGFGATSTPATATVAPFGQTTSSVPAFGAAGTGGLSLTSTTSTPAAVSSGFNFGLGATPAATSSTGLTGFGTAAKPPAFGSLGAGLTTTTSTTSSLNFGGTPASSAAPALGAFGATTAAPAFGAPTSTPAFGAATSTPAFGAVTSTPAFGAATSTAGFGLGGSTAAFGVKAATTSAPPAFGTTGLGGTTQASVVGLGGTGTALTGTSQASGEGNKSDPKALKETPVPPEICQTVEEFKKYVKEERSTGSDIAHVSSKVHQKIQSETEAMAQLVTMLAAGLTKNKAQLDKLKKDTAQELLNVEIAQRTKDTPPALQYENIAPYEYFSRLVREFEVKMLQYRRQIEETEQHLQAMATASSLSPEDLTRAIHKLHAAFTSLAGKFQTIHDSVKQQKDIYNHLHRQRHGTATDIFDQRTPSRPLKKKVPTTLGPSPFTVQQDPIAIARASVMTWPQQQQQQQQQQQPSTIGPPTLALNSSIGGFGSPSVSKPFNTSFSTPFNTSTPGLLGSTISPFANTSNQGIKKSKP